MTSHRAQNVMVTGGCGFIGSNFINYLFRAWPHAKIVNVDKLILNSDALHVDEQVRSSSRYRLVLADIKNKEAINNILVEEKIDSIIHFAADCTSTRCYNETIEAIENNLISFITFLETVRDYGKVGRFLHISTDEVYGDSGLGSDEEGKAEYNRLLPGNPYAATKIAGEAYARAFIEQYKLPIVTARMNNIYGPNQWNVKVVPRFIEIAKAQGEYTIQGTGQQLRKGKCVDPPILIVHFKRNFNNKTRDYSSMRVAALALPPVNRRPTAGWFYEYGLRSWLFVEDASAGVQAVFEKGTLGEVYNLGTYYEKSVADLAHHIQNEVDRQLGKTPTTAKFVSIPDRPYNDLRYLIDISKAVKELGWSPKVSFDDGMRRTIASALEEKKSIRMHVAIYGGRGYVGQELQKTLTERGIPFKLAEKKPGIDSDEEVEHELVSLLVSHVVCVTGRTHGPGCPTIEFLEGGPDKVNLNLRDNMYNATVLAHLCRRLGHHYTYIGTGYIFAYDKEHPIGGPGFKEEDDPTFFGSSYSVVKGFTDRQKGWENINARITLPLSFDLEQPRNLLSKIINYKELFDIPVSISILPDCLDSLVSLMEQRIGATLNLVNPQPISLYRIVELYKKYVDNTVCPKAIGPDTERAKVLLATKGNCALDTSMLQKLQPSLPSAEESLVNRFSMMGRRPTA